jgi:WD40 repeat protein
VNRHNLITHIGTHTSPVYALAFSPDGSRLISGEHDRSVRLYSRHRTIWGFRVD